jgi:hypothetical protein
MTIRPKDRKLAELILFISERSEGDPRFGAGKVNKLLFYSDFGAYLTLGKSITGQPYQKLGDGPAPRRIAQVRDALVARGELAIREKEAGSRSQNRSFALRSANLADFSADEIALVARLIQQSWEYDGNQKGYFSKDSAYWDEDVAEFETIPYEWALLSKRPPTQKDRRMCEASAAIASAILSGERKVYPVNEKTSIANKSRVRRANQRRSAALVRSNARRD